MFKPILLILIFFAVPHIAQATESHCKANESVIWSCSSNKKVYSLCASKKLDAFTGYLQYRAGYLKKPVFFYPSPTQHPRKFFKFELRSQASSINFRNEKYFYQITDQINGESFIEVTKNEKAITFVSCADSTQTLNNTSSINLFETIGIYK